MKSTIYIHFCQTSTCDLSNARNKYFALNQNRQVVPLVAIASLGLLLTCSFLSPLCFPSCVYTMAPVSCIYGERLIRW